jgi:Cu-Zn family superoxide dismutase
MIYSCHPDPGFDCPDDYWDDWNYDMQETAYAILRGGPLAPDIRGIVTFECVSNGTLVCVNVKGLPCYRPGQYGRQPIGPHGFHIHEHGNCQIGDPENPFMAAGEHYNPTGQPHGNHAGDLPVLFSNNGRAFMTVFTNKFLVADVIGRSVIIHQNPDDFRTQPAGNSGKKLACGVIRPGTPQPY